ncbi:MAG: 3-dehydroquinate synthase [Vulcanibacillus sp.]
MTQLTISTKKNIHSYSIIIEPNIYSKIANYIQELGISREDKILIITDSNVAPLYLTNIMDILNDYKVIKYIVPAGEESKSFAQVERIIEYAILNELDRKSVVIALGGGVVGDLAGFVSSVYMRGISFIQCPTTILAHDSSVGGKVGINHPLGKNMIGSFHQPSLVLYDTSFLKTLSEREIRSGYAEMIKHGLISDNIFSNWLFDKADALLNLDLEYVNEAIHKGIKVKAEIVKEDEKEQGIRAILNYGHTLAHAIETISKYQFLHGEAVAIGMVFASKLACKLEITSQEVGDFTLEIIKKFKLPTLIPTTYNTDEIINIMMRDKKFRNNQIRMVLPTTIGSVMIKEGIEKKTIAEVIEESKE